MMVLKPPQVQQPQEQPPVSGLVGRDHSVTLTVTGMLPCEESKADQEALRLASIK